MNEIIQWLLFILTFMLGYFTGKEKLSREAIQEAKKEIEKKLNPKAERVGALKRPSPQQIWQKNNPNRAEEEEMEKTFSEFPELNEDIGR